MVTRNVPVKVLNILRSEVGFHCPADRNGKICGSPYLTWHHFDPPWKVEKHHRPEGMIALCREHADKADNKSYTDEQLRILKREGRSRGTVVSGSFDWMRRDMVALVGGNAYVETDVLIQDGNQPAVWFTTNATGEKMLNFRMPTVSGKQRAALVDNFWRVNPKDLKTMTCPPSGRLVEIKYANGDYLKFEFSDIGDVEQLKKKIPKLTYIAKYAFNYPFTLVEVEQEVAGTQIRLTSTESITASGAMSLGDCVMEGSTIAIGGPSGVRT